MIVKNSKVVKLSLEVTHEITKLIKLSPRRRDNIFRELKAESELKNEINTLSIRLLCPTRWTVRANSLLSVVNNYSTLLGTWEMADVARDTDGKARIQGVKAQMNTFRFAFGTMLAEMILRHTDNLSRSLLQDKVCSAAEGQTIGDMLVDTLQSLRNDSSFELFW